MIPLLLSLMSPAALSQTVDVGGYLRVGARPDLQGGDGRLGYWNLYGRLLNEGPYAVIDMRAKPLPRRPDSLEPWTSLHMRIEGGSTGSAVHAAAAHADLVRARARARTRARARARAGARARLRLRLG